MTRWPRSARRSSTRGRTPAATRRPHFSSSLWYALGPDAEERLRAYVYRYMKIFDEGYAEHLASTAPVHSPDALRDAIDAARDAGCDELFLVPTSADPDELARTRDALGI